MAPSKNLWVKIKDSNPVIWIVVTILVSNIAGDAWKYMKQPAEIPSIKEEIEQGKKMCNENRVMIIDVDSKVNAFQSRTDGISNQIENIKELLIQIDQNNQTQHKALTERIDNLILNANKIGYSDSINLTAIK